MYMFLKACTPIAPLGLKSKFLSSPGFMVAVTVSPRSLCADGVAFGPKDVFDGTDLITDSGNRIIYVAMNYRVRLFQDQTDNSSVHLDFLLDLCLLRMTALQTLHFMINELPWIGLLVISARSAGIPQSEFPSIHILKLS
jgi:hypothetical protein